MEVELGFGENNSKIDNDDWMIARRSAMALYIYRVGRSCPCWS
jgi:hypothetical protein